MEIGEPLFFFEDFHLEQQIYENYISNNEL